mgnify:FL=1
MTKNKKKNSKETNKDTLEEGVSEETIEKELNENAININENLKLEIEKAIEDRKRALADAENTRRRSIKDLEQARKYGHLSLSREILSVVDSLEKAVLSAPKEKDKLSEEVKNFIIGVEMTLEQLKQVFSNHNIARIDPIGEKFDYNIHQAMFEKETDEVEQGTIIEVMQPGWSLHDRLLRPAMVGVSKKKIKH